MVIVSLKTGADGELNKIELSDGSLFSFKVCYLPSELFSILDNPAEAQGMEISDTQEAAFRHASACLQAEKAALRLIARAEQCSAGLRRKLEKREHSAACAGEVVSRLAGIGLIDDRRYAQMWIESRLRLTRSPRRLLVSLCSRGIDRDDAQDALKAALDEETEWALISRFVKKHSRKARLKAQRNTGRGSGQNKISLKHLLKSEGFSPHLISRLESNL